MSKAKGAEPFVDGPEGEPPAGTPLTAEELAEVARRDALPDSGEVPERLVLAVWQTRFWGRRLGHEEELALTDRVKLAAQSGKLIILDPDTRTRLDYTPAPKPVPPARIRAPRVRPGSV